MFEVNIKKMHSFVDYAKISVWNEQKKCFVKWPRIFILQKYRSILDFLIKWVRISALTKHKNFGFYKWVGISVLGEYEEVLEISISW